MFDQLSKFSWATDGHGYTRIECLGFTETIYQLRHCRVVSIRVAGMVAGIIESESPSMRYTVILEQEPDGGYVATVPALPGCVSQGDTRDEVMGNIRAAADLYVEDCIASGDPVPTEAGREYFELKTGTC